MTLKLRFYDGREDDGSTARGDTRLMALKSFRLFALDAKTPVYTPEGLEKWFSNEPGPDEVVVGLLHFTQIKDIVERVKTWNPRLRQVTFLLLMSGRGATTEMRAAASELREKKAATGVWTLKPQFDDFVWSAAWKGMTAELAEAKSKNRIREILESRIAAINGEDAVLIDDAVSSPVPDVFGGGRLVTPGEYGTAFRDLLEALDLLEDREQRETLLPMLSDALWWRNGLKNPSKENLAKALQAYVKNHCHKVPWAPVASFVEALYPQGGDTLLAAAKRARDAFETQTDLETGDQDAAAHSQ